jgi:hypothetical protein
VDVPIERKCDTVIMRRDAREAGRFPRK